MTKLERLCREIPEIKEVKGKRNSWNNQHTIYYVREKEKFTIPQNLYVEVTGTSIKGTIGRVVDIEIMSCKREDNFGNEIMALTEYSGKVYFEVSGRNRQSGILFHHCNFLDESFNGPTQWVRNVKDRKKDLKNPVNKFGQMLQEGDWIIGVGKSRSSNKPLRFGRVTRWTNKNVWASMNYDAQKDERDEFQLNSISETFLLPKSNEHTDALMLAVVKGWNGS